MSDQTRYSKSVKHPQCCLAMCILTCIQKLKNYSTVLKHCRICL